MHLKVHKLIKSRLAISEGVRLYRSLYYIQAPFVLYFDGIEKLNEQFLIDSIGKLTYERGEDFTNLITIKCKIKPYRILTKKVISDYVRERNKNVRS